MANKLTRMRGQAKTAAKATAELREGVKALRSEIFELEQQREALKDRPCPREEIERRVDRLLDEAEQEAGETFVAGVFALPADEYRVKPDFESPFKQNQVGALCMLGMRDTVRASLIAKALAAAKQFGPAMSDAEREAEYERLSGDIEIAEISEESLIREADSGGMQIWRRRDARPEIYLAEKL